MRFTNIEYTNFLYDKKYEFQISQKPIVLLLGQDYLNNSEIKNLFYFIKKYQVKWIITTGYIAIKYEEYLDDFLEDCSIGQKSLRITQQYKNQRTTDERSVGQ